MPTRAELVNYASNGRVGYVIAAEIFGGIITVLRRDPRFRHLSILEFELMFADTRADTEEYLIHELRDRVHLDDIGEDE
jgi:hypothetical protein